MNDAYTVAELTRMLHNMIQITTITSADHVNRKLRVRIGTGDSAELPWPADVGRNWVRWKPLRVGQQVVIACPSGDTAQAVIIGNLYSNEIDSPETAEELDVFEFTSGARIEHNINTGVLDFSGFADVRVNSISVPFHVHKQVRKGADLSGEPN